MSKISCGQAFSLLLMVGFFNIVCSNTPYSAEHMAGLIFSALLQCIMVVPAVYLYNRRNFSIETIPKWIAGVYTAYFIIYGGFAFSRFYTIAKGMNFPVDNRIFAIVLIAIVCLYSALLGIKAVGRGAVIISAIFILSLILLFTGAYSKADFSRFSFEKPSELFSMGFSNFIFSSELAIIFIIFSFLKNNKVKCAYSFIASKLVISLFIAFSGIVTLGSISDLTDFPFFALSAYSQPFSVQRADSVYITLFAVLSAVTIALFIIFASALLRIIWKKMKYNEFAVTLAMLVIALIFNGIEKFSGAIWIIMTLIIYVGIPFIMIGGEETEKSSN